MNREIVIPSGAGIYPLIGDVSSTAGNPTVVVTGLQNTPVQDTFFEGGEVLAYNPNTNSWTPTLRAAIQVNNVTVSDDSIISVNVAKEILVNGA